MMMIPPLDDDDEPPARLSARAALVSIFGFWLFYALIVTLRVSITDIPVQDELARRRIYVTLAGMAITLIVWFILRAFDAKSLLIRVCVAAFTCIPAAFAIALANHYFFNLFDQASLMEIEQIRAGSPSPGQWVQEITEVAVSRYFFLIAWTSLYLALGYAHQVRFAERRAARFARSAQLSELRALRYQLNPHFLFNTLNSLSALIMHGRKDEAEATILNLSSFYRANLGSDPSGDVPLSEEFETQRLYLAIEAIRFPERLSVEVHLPAALGSILVPGMILQPLVENAIKHGVARTSEAVRITITASQHNQMLEIKVSDNAPPGGAVEGHRIGLSNVRDRLLARFGPTAEIAATQAAGGYSATLRLPVIANG